MKRDVQVDNIKMEGGIDQMTTIENYLQTVTLVKNELRRTYEGWM